MHIHTYIVYICSYTQLWFTFLIYFIYLSSCPRSNNSPSRRKILPAITFMPSLSFSGFFSLEKEFSLLLFGSLRPKASWPLLQIYCSFVSPTLSPSLSPFLLSHPHVLCFILLLVEVFITVRSHSSWFREGPQCLWTNRRYVNLWGHSNLASKLRRYN